MRFTDIAGVNAFLDAIPKFQDVGQRAARMGLESIRSFCGLMENPQDSYAVIHVAGTNGKGTVCHLLANGYTKAGCRAGLYTSPHLYHFKERIKVDGQEIPDEGLLRFFQTHEELINTSGLTYFELTTALAFWWFAEQHVDIAIIETGLGGRLDATNIVKPIVSVITSIGLDHQEYLGETLGDIAREKAGIIKRHVPVVTGRLPDEAVGVIKQSARNTESPFCPADELNPVYRDGKYYLTWKNCRLEVKTDLEGSIQAVNLAVCRRVMDLTDQFPVNADQFLDAARTVRRDTGLKARFEPLVEGELWFFDGAHNPEALQVLKHTISDLNYNGEITLVLSLMRDKLKKALLNEFSDFKKIRYYTMQSERAATFEEIHSFLTQAEPLFSLREEIQSFLHEHRTKLVIFTGSFYFYTTVRDWVTNFV